MILILLIHIIISYFLFHFADNIIIYYFHIAFSLISLRYDAALRHMMPLTPLQPADAAAAIAAFAPDAAIRRFGLRCHTLRHGYTYDIPPPYRIDQPPSQHRYLHTRLDSHRYRGHHITLQIAIDVTTTIVITDLMVLHDTATDIDMHLQPLISQLASVH